MSTKISLKYSVEQVQAAQANGANSMNAYYKALTGKSGKPGASFRSQIKAMLSQINENGPSSPATAPNAPAPVLTASDSDQPATDAVKGLKCRDGRPNPYGKNLGKMYAALVGLDLSFPEALQIGMEATGQNERQATVTLDNLRDPTRPGNKGKSTCTYKTEYDQKRNRKDGTIRRFKLAEQRVRICFRSTRPNQKILADYKERAANYNHSDNDNDAPAASVPAPVPAEA